MENNNSPRRTRSGKILGGATPEGEVERHDEEILVGAERIVREEAVMDLIDLTEDYVDVDAFVDNASRDLRDVTGITRNASENGTTIIIDDDDDDDPIDIINGDTGDNELNTNRTPISEVNVTVDLTVSPSPSSNQDMLIPKEKRLHAVSSVSATACGSASTSTSTSEPSTSNQSPGPPNASASVSCRICLESQFDLDAEGYTLLSTVCGHIFCSKCLPNYIKKRGLCPICRRVLRPRDFHPIFI